MCVLVYRRMAKPYSDFSRINCAYSFIARNCDSLEGFNPIEDSTRILVSAAVAFFLLILYRPYYRYD